MRVGTGTVLGHVNRVLAPLRAPARPRPGEHRHRHRRRRRRQQLGRDALRRDQGLLLDPALADLRAPLGDAHRHRRARRRGRVRGGRAGARRGPRGDPRRDPRRRRAGRPHPRASSRSRTRPATASARSSTPTSRWRSSAACWSAPRGRWPSSPRSSSRPCRSRPLHDRRLGPLHRHRRAVEPVRELVAAGASAVELMVAPGADHRRLEHGRRARRSGRSSPGRRALLVEFGADDGGGARRAVERGAEAILAGHETDPRRPAFTREPEEIEIAWRVREGLHGLVGRAAAAGHVADRRGRLRAAGPDRRGAARPAGAARRARLPPRGGRPRVGREPALHAHPGLLRAGGPRALRGASWRRWSS